MSRTLLYNARIINPARISPTFTALLMNQGIFEQISTRKPRVGAHVKQINLDGNYVIPGFVDSHTHLIARGIELQRIDLESCSSLDNCLGRLRAEHKNRDIIFGSNWDESNWTSSSRGQLNKHLLDRVSTKQPVIMRRVCGHCAVVNTTALNRIPARWKIVNRRTGWLFEDAALFLNDIFKPDPDTEIKAVQIASLEAARCGITSIHEIGDLKRLSLLQKIHRNGKLKVRIAFYVLLHNMSEIVKAGLESSFGDDTLRFAGIKVFMDGSIGARTAALTRPYYRTRKKGLILISRKRLASIIRTAEQNNLQLMVHSIGDRTTREVLSAFEQTIDPKNPLRHRLEHLELLDTPSINKLSHLHLIASMQPNFVKRWQQPGGMYEQYLGERYKSLNCFQTMYKAGIHLAFGSDCMPLGPLYGIQGAVEHPFPCGRMTRAQALTLYTYGSAFASRDEHKKGRIRKGMLADLVVTNANPLSIKHLDSLTVLMTIKGGKIVFTK